ncbi:MAG: DUF1553 domain-containing protein [Acidobacteriota bacterium]
MNVEARARMLCLACWCVLLLVGTNVSEGADSPVLYNRDIRPILSDTCYTCHGPDQANRKTAMRLDTQDGALADLGGYSPIVPGQPSKSEVFRRITAQDEAIRMPPVYSDRKLTAGQIELIQRWIEQGAQWQQHWAFIRPERPVPPTVKDTRWPKNSLDHFVLHRLEQEGLSPSPEADRATLIRRVSLDLTGLPPQPSEVETFLNDSSPNAYEKVVDRLLRSPRYGERMAIRWLEAARYADTNGYQTDGERTMWRWRDWVIEAFNRNLPFDQFTIEQLAGDLLPNATMEQKLATGFNRNHRGNGEGGIIPEEYAVEYVADRVETTSAVWLGLTMGCARCHDHKYDPIKQKEFYQVFAYFNNVPERGKAFKYGNSHPVMPTPTRRQQKELGRLDLKLAEAAAELERLEPRVRQAQAEWEKSLDPVRPFHWATSEGLMVHFPLDGNPGELQTGGPARFLEREGEFELGKMGLAAKLDGVRYLQAGDVAKIGFYDKFSFSAWVFSVGGQGGAILSRTKEVPQDTGYSFLLSEGRLQLNLVTRWLDDALRVETESTLSSDQWHHVLVSYDGSRLASGVTFYVDGQIQKNHVLLDELNQPFASDEPFRIGSGGGVESRFQGLIDDVRVYDRVIPDDEVQLLANADPLNLLATEPLSRRSPVQSRKLRTCFLQENAPPDIRRVWERMKAIQRDRQNLLDQIPTTMVMQEMDTPRPAHLLIRGAYDRPGEEVHPGVPSCLPPLPDDAPRNRLGLARWLVDPKNPLPARVTVNRFWQMLFGTGLVKTVEDFGSQGEAPSHPELLDWLATELVGTGWNVKAVLKEMVMSATYRQSSNASSQVLQRDPENRLLARGPRQRLSAEMVRDQALALSGLLMEKLGGPSVKPYQPDGLWAELSGEDYQRDSGDSLYRRSLYTFWKRTAPPPMMMNFDAAGRETCVVRENRTNTPLQALNLMNDVTFLEAARALAQQVMLNGGQTTQDRIRHAFRVATARRPRPKEEAVLKAGWEKYVAEYRSQPKLAFKLLTEGEYPVDERLDPAELAAYTMVASLILNLDEVLTKE